jgi:hypothetical protein
MVIGLVLLSNNLDLLAKDVWEQLGWLQRVRGISIVCIVGFLIYVISLVLMGLRPADLRGPNKATSRQ